MSFEPAPVTVIVLAWNRWALTERCLETLMASDLEGARVIVVNNGSEDETAERLEAIPRIQVMHLQENLGFVRGNNHAIAATDPQSDVLLLNNDMEITQRDWLQRLRRTAHSADHIGVVGCRLQMPGHRLQHAGTYIMPDTMWGQQIGANEKDLGQYSGLREVQGIVFACAYIRRQVLERIGGLSEDFLSYFEDTDFCLRARQAGFRIVVDGGVTLLHHEHGSTRGNEEGLMEVFQKSRAVFRRKWQSHLEGVYRHRLVMQSILNFPSGYATSCREILKELERQGVRTAYRYVYGPGTVYPKREPRKSDDYCLNIFASREVERRPRVSLVYGQGDVFKRGLGKTRIGYTMLEVDGFPKEWVRQANQMAEVWVPSRFNREAFIACGLTRPIHIIPLGVNTDYFHPRIEGFPNPFGEFLFLSAFEWGERKSPWLLLEAFNRSFRADEKVRLVCKIGNNDRSVRLKHEIRKLGLDPAGGKISYLFNEEYPRYQLGSLYRSADCFVSPSRGEGWNMPLMEAMACGLPVIATDWGPHQEYLHDGIGYLLQIRGTVPAVAKCPYYSGFSWADPDPEHLCHLLRHVYENREEARVKGAAAAREMADRWSWRAAVEKMVARLDALVG